ncbi:MAG: DUF1826 domain-containing protein [Bacteroidota bacterium]
MSIFPFTILSRLSPKVPFQIISGSWNDRDAILRSDVNLFCWQRPVDLEVEAYLQSLLEDQLKPIRVHLSEDKMAEKIDRARTMWKRTLGVDGDAFWQDVTSITKDFLQFSATGQGTMHLRVVDDDACTKFHTDGYALRLFITYLGPGTEWVPEVAVRRSALGRSNEEIVKDPERVQRLGTQHVGILKGAPQKGAKGIVHRSPSLSGTGKKRIILRVDI